MELTGGGKIANKPILKIDILGPQNDKHNRFAYQMIAEHDWCFCVISPDPNTKPSLCVVSRWQWLENDLELTTKLATMIALH